MMLSGSMIGSGSEYASSPSLTRGKSCHSIPPTQESRGWSHNPSMADLHSPGRAKADPIDDVPEPVAIIGIGCRFPGGVRTPGGFWELLCRGTDCISEIAPDRWNIRSFYDPEPGKPGRSYSKWAGLTDNIDNLTPRCLASRPGGDIHRPAAAVAA